MKTLLVILIFVTSSFICQPDDKKYKFIKKEEGITLYFRWIDTPTHREVRELKAEFNIASSPENIISGIKNERTALLWMKGASQFQRIGKSTETSWYSYILYNIPWPLSNQDCIILHTLHKEPTENIYYIRMKGVPDYIPEKEGIIRIHHLQGTWKITKINANESRVVYTIYSAQAPKFPRWVTDPIIQENLLNTMLSFKKTVEDQNK